MHAYDPAALGPRNSPHDAADPEVALTARHSILGPEFKLQAFAWDGERRQFWISSGREVYAVDPAIAIRTGRLDPAPGRHFEGSYSSLAVHGGSLWAWDPEM